MEEPRRHLSRLLLLAPAIAVICVYWQVVHFDYVWDDWLILERGNHFNRDWATLWQAIFEPFLTNLAYFRPLPLLILGAEQLLFDGRPFVPHFDTLILHAVNSVLVAVVGFIICGRSGGTSRRALVAGVGAGLLYALHPALIQSAAAIFVRFDALMTFFALLALVADRLIASVPVRAMAVSLLFLASALSKEMALGWALLLPLWHSMFLSREKSWRDLLRGYARDGHLVVYAGIFLAGLVYLAMRASFEGQVYSHAATEVPFATAEHLAFVLKTFGKYLILACWPFTSVGALHHFQRPIAFSDPEVQVGMAGVLLFVALLWRAVSQRRWRSVLPCCFAIALLPVLNLIPLQLGDSYVQERFLTLPLVFAALWAALVLAGLFDPHPRLHLRATIGASVVIFWFAFSVLIIRTSLPCWRDDLSFAVMAHARDPDSMSGDLNLQRAYLGAGMFQEAKDFSEQLRDQQHGALYAPQQISYAFALGQLGDVEEGINYMLGALSIMRPSAANIESLNEANWQLGVLYLKDGRPDLASDRFRAALSELDSPQVAYLLALASLASGGEAKGRQLMEQALADMHPSLRELRRAEIPDRLAELKRAIARNRDRTMSTGKQ